MDAGSSLLLLLAAMVTGLVGLWVFYMGWAQKADAVERSRLASGDRASRRLRSAVERRLRTTTVGQRLEQALMAGGVQMGVADWLGICVAAWVSGFVAASTIFPDWTSVLIGFVALLGCRAWLTRQRLKRREEFINQLPELARVLSNASQAGLSLRSSLDMAATELDSPGGEEMGLVSQELRLGQSVDRALENLSARMPSREVGVLVSTLVIQQRAGGDIVRALRDMAETLDARKNLRREVRTIMSGAVYTSYVVAILGCGSVLMLNLLDPGLVERMANSLIGQAVFVVAGAMYFLGFSLIRRTTRIET